ncbi:hypothetical protein KIN20_020405 [Parelaphostrongylus tenuis]|uniref:Uncharacterized protein n=1 Tax=Parelaphostrongylus tenuis TaxID=148309 RepID=A0AAD5LZK5_PARTN|nr:hypothetical protein KIN20_003705 [Parelaphostrongylus tenuis]KAJ1361208.1 hypothetical protein KIN20_020405 [Parelaphostrongylus tenuis]
MARRDAKRLPMANPMSCAARTGNKRRENGLLSGEKTSEHGNTVTSLLTYDHCSGGDTTDFPYIHQFMTIVRKPKQQICPWDF